MNKTINQWQGIFKVLEECGELSTVLGKLGPYPDGNHPDGAGNLIDRLQDELGDVLAACTYFAQINNLDLEYIAKRKAKKEETYKGWILTGVPF